MKKLLLSIITILLVAQCGFAKTNDKFYKEALKKADMPRGAVSFSFRDVETGNIVSELNSEIATSPASTQKLLTYLPSLKVLGEDYNFSTKLYKTKSNDYYIVLGADPYLTSKDLTQLISNIKIEKGGEIKNFYIDDTILDNKTWGEGWQWDDDLNSLMPKFGAYNIDKNLYKIIVKPTRINCPANIFTSIFYPTTFINETKTTFNETNLSLIRENFIAPDALIVSGPVAEQTTFEIPVNYIRRYFILRLDEAFKNNKIIYTGKYPRGKVPQNAALIGEINHPITLATEDVLKNSNNLVAETVFKLAGGKYTKSTGTHTSAMAMFNNFNRNIDCTRVRLTDGSGVSKNNLVTADFMSDYLTNISHLYGLENLQKILATSGEGTLSLRMIPLKDKLWAKTGTLSNVSGIAGYITTKQGKTYAFGIYINDGKKSISSMKLTEELILRHAYNKL